jgi:putative tricarboxylic transport membrane protein
MTAARIDWPGTAAALGFLALGGYAVAESYAMTPLGAVFPRTVGALMAGLSLVQLVRCLRGRAGPRSGEGGEGGGSAVRRAAMAAILLVWALVFPVVGFLVTGTLAGLALLFVAEFEPVPPRTLALRAAAVVAMVLISWWLMTAVLLIPMPAALLF